MIVIVVILSVVGWVWCAIAGIYLAVALRNGNNRQGQGFEVIERHGK